MSREATGQAMWTARTGRGGRIAVRCDRPGESSGSSDGRERELAPESPGLLAAILQAIRAEPADRREGVRHPAAGADVWLGWWSGDELVAIRGRARDISRGGARVVTAVRPPRGASVWLYAESPEGDAVQSARGEVVGHTPAPGGLYAVRLCFAAPCPTELIEAIACRRDEG
jgi:hypothetical protein